MIHSHVFNLEHVNVSTCLLVQEILLHGVVNFLTGHFVLEFTADRLVNLVHVGADVLTGQDGWCTKDAHGLSSVVVGVSGVATCTWVESVVDGEIPDLVVAGDGFTGCTLVILDGVEVVKVDEVVVEVVDGGRRMCVKGRRQELGDQRQASVLSVDGG